MTPLHFGSGARRLFGLYTPGRGTRGVVICNPWGNEYLAAHRTLRQLDAQLAAAGLHVLRFDYFGTGDSAGELEEADLAGWEADIAAAMEELRDSAGSTRVGLVGLRLGGTLAARVAASRAREVDALVLWDPVTSGNAYLGELRALADPGSSPPEVAGFAITPALARDLAAVALPVETGIAARTLALDTGTPGRPEALRAAIAPCVAGVLDIEAIPDTPVWVEDRFFGASGLPVKVMQRIVEWMR